MKNLFSVLKKRPITLIIIWGLILEFPIRYFFSPDPWIHNADHWYFIQPNRLFIEIGFILLAVLPLFFVKEIRDLFSLKWTRKNTSFLFIGLIISILIFGLQQWEEVKIIHNSNLGQYIPVWFATGMAIGVGQELTFRGLIYTGLNNKFGLKGAIVISTLCFAIGSIHSIRMYTYFIKGFYAETILLFLIFVFAGLFFVWIRIKTKNIIIPALIHGIGNAITWYTFVIVKLYVN